MRRDLTAILVERQAELILFERSMQPADRRGLYPRDGLLQLFAGADADDLERAEIWLEVAKLIDAGHPIGALLADAPEGGSSPLGSAAGRYLDAYHLGRAEFHAEGPRPSRGPWRRVLGALIRLLRRGGAR